jgi:hypothetical protein
MSARDMRRFRFGRGVEMSPEQMEERAVNSYMQARQMESIALSWRPFILRELAKSVLPKDEKKYVESLSMDQLRGIAKHVKDQARRTITQYEPMVRNLIGNDDSNGERRYN